MSVSPRIVPSSHLIRAIPKAPFYESVCIINRRLVSKDANSTDARHDDSITFVKYARIYAVLVETVRGILSTVIFR